MREVCISKGALFNKRTMSFGGYTQISDLDFNWAPDTNPDGIGGSFSGAHTPSFGGFGPGDYSGGYTGQGDSIYWGPFNDTPTTNPGGPTLPVHIGPGIILQQAAGDRVRRRAAHCACAARRRRPEA